MVDLSELVKNMVKDGIEFGYVTAKSGVDLKAALKRYNEILDEKLSEIKTPVDNQL